MDQQSKKKKIAERVQKDQLPLGGHCWWHPSSKDLLHWNFCPTALPPGKNDPDDGLLVGANLSIKRGL